MFKKKNKDKDKDSKKSKSGNFDKELLNNDNQLLPNSEENSIDKSKTYGSSNSEFEVWRSINNNTDKNNKNNKNKLVLTEYLEKSKNYNNNNSENLLMKTILIIVTKK